MSDTEITEKNGAPATAAGADERAAQVRHRFVGALCILAVAVLLWELGDDVPPPNFSDTQTPVPQFPKKDFVQIQTSPPTSQIQNIPAPAQPNADNASASLAPPADNNAATATLAAATLAATTLAVATPATASLDPEPQIENIPPENLVQVGAFQQGEGAEQLARWLRGDGFEVVVRKDNDGLHRVFSSADPEHLVALGYISENESLSSPSPSESESPSSPSSSESESPSSSSSPSSSESKTESDSDSASASSPFVVQLGAFSNEKRAREMAAELRAQQFAARIEPVRRGGETLFRVRVVGLADRDSAEATRRRLAEMGHAAAQTMDTR